MVNTRIIKFRRKKLGGFKNYKNVNEDQTSPG
jgi:hypothetical protein